MKKVPKVLQEGTMDCGVACLYAILKYYHGSICYEKLKKMVQVTEKGTNAFSLLKGAENLGFLVEARKGEITKILPTEYPVIAHIRKDGYYHFVVVMGVDKKRKVVQIMDPSVGYVHIDLFRWMEICTGNYLFFSVQRFLVKEKNQSIWKLLLPKSFLKKSLFVVMLLYLCLVLFEMFSLQEINIFFSYLLTRKDEKNMLHYFSFFFLFSLLVEWGTFLVQWFFLKIRSFFLAKLLEKWIQMLLSLPYYYFEQHQASEILAQTDLLEEIYVYFFQIFQSFFLEVPFFLFCFFLFCGKYGPFCFVALFLFLLCFLVSLFFGKRLERGVEHFLKQKDKRNGILLDCLEKLDVLKGLHQESFFKKKLKKASFLYQESSYHLLLSKQQEKTLQKIWVKSIHTLFLFFFFLFFFEKEGTFSNYFFLHLLLEMLCNNYLKIIEIYLLFPRIKVEVRKFESIFITQKEVFPRKSILPLAHFTKLEVKHFSYQLEGRHITTQFSCLIQKGEKVLLHGASGSGKSTLFKNLIGYYPPQMGQIYFNDFDLLYLHLEDIRSRVCYLSQEEGLFSGSLLENITFGKKVTKEKLDRILSLTHVDRILKEKKLSIKAPITLLNLPFSGGERKKILLARVLLLERDIYLLDEVFESIEKEEAMELIKNVLAYLHDKIVLVISHRSDVDQMFDQVLYLQADK